jgi:tRNA threonylcarbamoyladenosine biosynthesis protein TsaB
VLLLAFDTATPVVTAALHDGHRVIAERTTVDARRHGELLAPAIQEALREAGVGHLDLGEIAVGVGPGPFTGLRVGLVTARTLSAVLGIPARGVCTLDILAAEAALPGPFMVATDARRREVYWARYADGLTRVDGPHVARPADIATTEPVVGRGAELYPDAFPVSAGPQDPSAAVLAEVVARRAVPLLPVEPLYLRRPDVAEPRGRKQVS